MEKREKWIWRISREREREREHTRARDTQLGAFFPLRNRYAVRTSRIETKEAKGRKRGREGGRKRKTESGRIVDTEIKNCAENEKKRGVERVETSQERNDLLSLGEPSSRRRHFAVFGPRKTERKLRPVLPLLVLHWGKRRGTSSDHSACCVASCCLFPVVCFLHSVYTQLPNRNTKVNSRTFTIKTVFIYVCKTF